MRYALVTGGLGFIGSFIARRLLKDGLVDKVVLLDHFGKYISPLREGYFDYRKFRLADIEQNTIVERGDPRYFSISNEIVLKYDPVYVFHLAALPLAKLDNLTPEEAWEGTIVSTSNLLQALDNAKRSGRRNLKRFLYASSSMVYGNFISEEATEDHPTNPKEIYGTMKLAGECVTKGLSNYYEVPSTIIRPSAVYGPTDMNKRVSQIYIEKAIRGKKLIVHGEDEKLDFTFVKDVAMGFVKAAISKKAVGETFNITYGKASRLLDFVLTLKEIFPDLEYEVIERDEFRPRRGTLCIEKARKIIGFNPQYDLRSGIGEYVDFVRKYHPYLKGGKE